MTGPLAPEPILRAALKLLHFAAYTTRNWTLSDEIPRAQVNDLWEAIHEIPDLVTRWQGDTEGLRELRMYLQAYDERWPFPKLEDIFEQALKDPGI
jgi:hypothetical protein